MRFPNTACIGIDPTAGRSSFTYAALDEDRHLITLSEGELEDILSFIGKFPAVMVAINAPSHTNTGLVRKRMEKQYDSRSSLRGVDLRIAEYELKARGISVSATPFREENCPSWVQIGFSMYRSLTNMGFHAYPHAGEGYEWLETHPHACFTVLIGQIPLPKPSLEGRLQRQIVLHDVGLGIKDPMDFFEEITRHRLKLGVMPMDFIYHPEQLDALVAAYTAWLAKKEPTGITRIGGKEEGYINLPANEIKEKY